MTMHLLFPFLLTILSHPMFIPSSPVQDPELIVREVERAINSTRFNVSASSCRAGNPIDDCWLCDQNWDENRQHLADCAIGFGKNATGGKIGTIYVVNNPGDYPKSPTPGTLRYGVIQDEQLWITFDRDMVIKLKEELSVKSFKTIDGRGANVEIAGGPGITIKYVTNIIVHGIHIHDCNGDGVSIHASSNIWIDHCSLSKCTDGLIDATHGSTAITISNNYMTDHDKVMLLGHADNCTEDRNMQVTVAFNHFGERLVQRMPRCRHGYFHVVNNDYTRWQLYPIGGSAAPTIISEGNRFLAPKEKCHKEVTQRFDTPQKEWQKWNWTSKGDLLLNGAHFTASGSTPSSSRSDNTSSRALSSLVAFLTKGAGVLNCQKGRHCYPTPKSKHSRGS